jgi:hypothetical protein
MGTVFLVVCLVGIAYAVIRIGAAAVREDLTPEPEKPPARAPEQEAAPAFPRPALFFIKPTTPLVVDGRLCRTDGSFGGVVNLEPGEHKVETPTHRVSCNLARDAMQVIDFSSGEPEFIDPTVGILMVRTLLRRAPPQAIMTAEELAGSPTPAEALRAAESSVDLLEATLGAREPRIFAEQNLTELEQAYAEWREHGAVEAYVDALRLHYIPDSQMAKQVPYFTRYAERVVAQVRESPPLATTEARRYLKYLAQDLVDTGDPGLATQGRALDGLLRGS